jgi:hypothetical protein
MDRPSTHFISVSTRPIACPVGALTRPQDPHDLGRFQPNWEGNHPACAGLAAAAGAAS